MDLAGGFGAITLSTIYRSTKQTELTSKLIPMWSEELDVELLFIQPGKPTQNAYIELFNNRVRFELLCISDLCDG